MRSLPVAACLCCLLAAASAAAAPPGQPVLLWNKVAPGSEGKTGPEKVDTRDGVRRVSSIHKPSLTPHLPAKGSGNGAAVIILPGGGHRYLAIDNEGHPVASWLSDHGIAAFVLKYRLAREEGSTYKVEQHALWDAQRAIRLVRSRARQWGIDPARVGLLGFSAGGQVTSYAAARFDAGQPKAADPVERESSRPAFQGLMYAGAAPDDVLVPKDAPPAFLLVAADDKNPTKNALGTFQKLRDAGIEAELHVFARGGHGFGLKQRPMSVTQWPDRFQQWLDEQGFGKPLPPPGTPPAAPTAAPAAPVPPRAATPAERELDQRYAATVKPFLAKYCIDCHGGDKPKAELDLRPYADLRSVVSDLPRWSQVAERMEAKEMPPKKAAQPPPESQHQVVAWIQAVRSSEASKHAGDPGTVLARRLSNAEYNNTVRDLTGVDIRPTREFPVDPANTAGFDNSGESLAMSPALLKKYLEAAREVANHMVLESEGLAFAPHPMLVETDRDKYCVKQIVDFYQQQNTDLGAYFETAWRYRNRVALGQPRATLASLAAERKVSPRYLGTVWKALEQDKQTVGPMARLQAMWRELPAAKRGQTKAADASELVKTGTLAMRDFVIKLRKKLEPRFTGPAVDGLQATSQPLAMWRNRQYASHRMSCDRDALQVEGKPLLARASTPKKPADEDAENDEEDAPTGRDERKAGPDPNLAVPAGQREKVQASFDRFCAVFPDTFYVQERGRNYLDKSRDKGRLLSAGFHNLMGYFRDDQPLYQLLLDPSQQKQLDRLWRELDFVADATRRTYLQFYFSGGGASAVRNAKQKGTSDAPRPPDAEVASQSAIEEIQRLFLTRIAPAKNEVGNQAIRDHFGWVNASLRWTESAHKAAEPKHMESLLALAARAYRRPLTGAEREGLLAYYRKLRAPGGQPGDTGLSHEEAMRDLVVSILMSPDFCYRIDLVSGGGNRPLSDHALASRLSYFLWSSMPDAELLAHAWAGDLHKPKVLVAQAHRMLKDPRVRGLATEFGGSWLDFRRFEEHNAVDRERFESFTNELRSAMFEEPVQFLLDLFSNGGSVLDLLYADHTFVNPVLAKHYGIPVAKGAGASDWVRVSDAGRYGRGGLLPMAVFLTKNAPGLRTSPVKRGYWVVKNVLGERIPPPPAVVPELPRDESKLDLPLRELLAKHREDAACSGCHARFDSLGLVFEGYGPVGEQRTQDLAGRPVDPRATFPGGSEGTGLAGLRAYLRSKRQDDFVDNLSRKLLAFGLGRTLVMSDEPAVAEMRARLGKGKFRFETLVDSVVLSPQFLTKRSGDAVASR